MKKGIVFILGVITGVFLTLVIATIGSFSSSSVGSNDGISMFDAPYEYDAKELYRAIHSFLSDDNVICEIIASRPKWMLDLINETYLKFYRITLIDEITKKKKW